MQVKRLLPFDKIKDLKNEMFHGFRDRCTREGHRSVIWQPEKACKDLVSDDSPLTTVRGKRNQMPMNASILQGEQNVKRMIGLGDSVPKENQGGVHNHQRFGCVKRRDLVGHAGASWGAITRTVRCLK